MRRRWPVAADAAGRARSAADRISHPGCLGADQVGGTIGGAGGAGRHHGDRIGSQPRSYRADAAPFRRDHQLAAGRRPWPPHRADRPAGAARRPGGGAGRSVLGGVSDGGGAAGAGLGRGLDRRHDQSAAHRAVHHAAGNGRLDRDLRAARRCRRADGQVPGQGIAAQGRRCTGRARPCDDRRISGAGGGGGLCRGHDQDARPAGVAGQGKRPAGSDRGDAARQRRRSGDRGRRSDRGRARPCAGRRSGRHPYGSSHRDVGAGDGPRFRSAGQGR